MSQSQSRHRAQPNTLLKTRERCVMNMLPCLLATLRFWESEINEAGPLSAHVEFYFLHQDWNVPRSSQTMENSPVLFERDLRVPEATLGGPGGRLQQ